MTSSTNEQHGSQIVDNPTLAFVVYILYIVGYFTGFTALIGVIIAHIQSNSENGYIQSHYRFQIRTFWIGLIYLIVGSVLAYVIVGIFVLIWWFIWSLIRIIKGILLLNKQEPIRQPASWGFGG